MGVIAFPTRWSDPGVDTLMDKNNYLGCLRAIPGIQVMGAWAILQRSSRFDGESHDGFSRRHDLCRPSYPGGGVRLIRQGTKVIFGGWAARPAYSMRNALS